MMPSRITLRLAILVAVLIAVSIVAIEAQDPSEDEGEPGPLTLAARGKSPAAFDWRCIPSGGVAPRSQMPQFAPSSRLAPAGRGIVTTRSRCNAGFYHGLPDLSGRLSVESRGFPAAPPFPGQRSLATGFVVSPTLYVDHVSAGSFTLTPVIRYDHSDQRRTHFDLQEAYLLLFGDAGEGVWEAPLGVDQVFWGVTESQRLVDIVNQVDFVEHPNGEAKLGQPMAP